MGWKGNLKVVQFGVAEKYYFAKNKWGELYGERLQGFGFDSTRTVF